MLKIGTLIRGHQLVIILVVLEFCSTLPVNKAACTLFSVARIAHVEYPTEARKGKQLTLCVTCEYASRVMADVGIMEENSSRIIQSITLISESVGPGNVTFTFTLLAPSVEGIWKLIATTRAWWADSWFSDVMEGARSFQIRIVEEDHVSVKLESELGFELDDIAYVSEGVMNFWLTRGSHSLRVESVRQINEGARLVFDQWSDGLRLNSRIAFVTSDVSLIARYRKEYRLVIKSDFGIVAGDGWYEANTDAQFGVAPSTPLEGFLGVLGFRSTFVRWEGDLISNSFIQSIRMDRPRVIQAVWKISWSPDLLTSLLSIAALAFFISSLMILLRSRNHWRPCGTGNRKLRCGCRILGLILLAVVPLTFALVPVHATEHALVQTGRTQWRHWGNTESSTCLIWVGGGQLGQPIMINPYWLESFNTMRYVQDLSEYYGILTLERGSETVTQYKLNRTIDAETYPSQSLQQLRRWARSTGYRYVFLVGYSVGGIAALNEAISGDPDGWGSPNGVILITVPITQSGAEVMRLRANLLLLYGEKMTDAYVQSGRIFHEKTRNEGMFEGAWFHKEIHVLSQVAHEVWTIADTGEYDPRAVFLTVLFIERSKTLQLTHEKDMIKNALRVHSPAAKKLRASVTKRARTNRLFQIEVDVSEAKDYGIIDIVAYDIARDEMVSLETLEVESSGTRTFLVVRSPETRERMQLGVLLLSRDSKDDITNILAVTVLEIDVTDLAKLTITTGNSHVGIGVDGTLFRPDASGLVVINSTFGVHNLEASQIINISEDVIDLFDYWSDGVRSPKRRLMITDDMQLQVFYRRLYHVEVSSQYGVADGTGWYDSNSMPMISVRPVVLERVDGEEHVWYVFGGWIDEQLRNSRTAKMVNGPAHYVAHWDTYSERDSSNPLGLLALFTSIAVFSASLLLSRTSRAAGAQSGRDRLCKITRRGVH